MCNVRVCIQAGWSRSLIACLERDVAHSEQQSALNKESLVQRERQIESLQGNIVALERELEQERADWEVVIDQVACCRSVLPEGVYGCRLVKTGP